MHTQTDLDDSIDWESILLKLETFVRSFAKGKPWFRGGDTQVFHMGKEVKDYVDEAILKYLENPEKFNPEKGSLLKYLQYNIIRSLISNDLDKTENKKNKDVFRKALQDDDSDDGSNYFDRIMPFTNAFFDDDIDYAQIIAEIELAVKNDKKVEEIFMGINMCGLTRAEIINEFKMTEKEYDNGMKRLKTILKGVALRFNIKKETV